MPDQFEDPELKAALQRAHGGHKASDALRRSVLAQLAVERPQPWIIKQRAMPKLVWWGLAACLLLAAGGGLYYWSTADAREQQQYLADNRAFLLAMIVTRTSDPEGSLVMNVTTPATLDDAKTEVGKKLGRAISPPDLSKSGWALTRVSAVPFQGRPAVRCDYASGTKHVTLYTMLGHGMQGVDEGENYQFIDDGSPIAGYIANCSVHCLVGDAGMTLADLTSLRDQLRKNS